jgi:hypothetical protein
MHDNFANAITSSSYDNNFPAPDIGVLAPVVCHRIVEPCAEASQQSQSDDSLQMLENGTVFRRKYVSTRGVAPEQDKRKRQRRVEDRELKKSSKCIASYSCKCS